MKKFGGIRKNYYFCIIEYDKALRRLAQGAKGISNTYVGQSNRDVNTMDSILVKAIQKATELLSLSNNNVMQALETVNAEMSQQRIDIAKHIAPQLTGGVEVDPQEGVDRLLLKLSNQLKDDDVVQFNGSSLQLVSSYILNQTIVGVLNKKRARKE